MRNLSEANLTQTVIDSMKEGQDARTKEILTSLVRHLHAFIREVRLTKEEWLTGIELLTAAGQLSDANRQEVILLSDTLGITALKDFVNHGHAPGATEYTILGPFYRDGAAEMPAGASIAEGIPGEPVLVSGRVLDGEGQPIAGALLDVWQASGEGFYDVQGQGLPDMGLRGRFRSDAEGAFHFRTIRPSSYPIPFDGPVGQMLIATARHPYRPAHIHFIVSAEGFEPVTTELYAEGDPYLESDAVFGVRDSLVVKFERREEIEDGAPDGLSAPYYHVTYDFVLEPEE